MNSARLLMIAVVNAIMGAGMVALYAAPVLVAAVVIGLLLR